MCGKVRQNFLLLATFVLISQIYCSSDIDIALDCFPTGWKYEKFRVDIYYFSRSKRNQLHDPSTKFEPGNIDFDPRRRTTVLVHGFLGSIQSMKKLSDSLLEWQDSNVIIVEWKAGCSDVTNYPQAVANTIYTAIKIRRLFRTFIRKWNNTEKSINHWGPIHLIGHSLGAHVAGQAAELLKRRDNLTVDRVTGLDPAGPCFENANSPLRLKSSNARFVDVIHTDTTTDSVQRFGLGDAIGHVDFYINGGSEQPGCNKKRPKRALNFFKLALHVAFNGICHHHRALSLFTETVKQASKNGCQFWARPWRSNSNRAPETKPVLPDECRDCVRAGILAENENFTHNIYYLPTTSEKPFCKLS